MELCAGEIAVLYLAIRIGMYITLVIRKFFGLSQANAKCFANVHSLPQMKGAMNKAMKLAGACLVGLDF